MYLSTLTRSLRLNGSSMEGTGEIAPTGIGLRLNIYSSDFSTNV